MRSFKLKDAIIGKGFLGSILKKKTNIKNIYNSKNIRNIENKFFNNLYIAAPSSKKFIANKNGSKDKKNILKMIKSLKKVKCNHITCLSTIDIYNKKNSSENTKVKNNPKNNYGSNRLMLINFIKKNFKNHLIIKLPSLFGANQKKGFFYDLCNKKKIEFYNQKTELQWYYAPDIIKDIKKLKLLKIKDINLVSKPISCDEISKTLEINQFFLNQFPILKYRVYSVRKYMNGKFPISKNNILKKMRKCSGAKR